MTYVLIGYRMLRTYTTFKHTGMHVLELMLLCAIFSIICESAPLVNLNAPASFRQQQEAKDSDSQSYSSNDCCSDVSCLYNAIIDGFELSKDFKNLGNLLYMNSGRPPDFVMIDVQVLWSEYNASAGHSDNKSMTSKYIWAETSAKAVFGPVQQLFIASNCLISW